MSFRKTFIKKKVFGAPLNKIPSTFMIDGIPLFLIDAGNYIMNHIREGIIRIPGDQKKISEMKKTIEHKGDFLKLANESDLDVYSVTSVMLEFLRDLPEPLIPFADFPSFIQCSKTYDFDHSVKETALSTMINTLHLLVKNLPIQNRRILAFYMNFFFVFSIQSEVHKMKSENIGVCIAPTLLHSKIESFEDSITNVQHQTLISTIMIKYYPLIFRDVCSSEGFLYPMYQNISRKKKNKLMTEINKSVKTDFSLFSKKRKQTKIQPKESIAVEIRDFLFNTERQQPKEKKQPPRMKSKLAASTMVQSATSKIEKEKMKSEVMRKRPKSESYATSMIFVREKMEKELELPRLEYKQLEKKKKKESKELKSSKSKGKHPFNKKLFSSSSHKSNEENK